MLRTEEVVINTGPLLAPYCRPWKFVVVQKLQATSHKLQAARKKLRTAEKFFKNSEL